MRITKLFKSQNSLIALIPHTIVKELKLQRNEYVVMEIFEREIVLSRLEIPPHIIKRLTERRQRVDEHFQGAGEKLKET